MGYQGYSNYETWAASLWINNDQGMLEYVEKHKANIDKGQIMPTVMW